MRRKLTELCDIQYGYAFDSAGFTEDSSYPPLVRIRDVKRGYSETYYSGEYPEEYVLHAGDLLVGMDGEFNIARWKSRDALLNQRVCKIIAKEGTDEEYLRFALSKALKEIENRTAFVTVKHLSAKELNKLELQVPALPEQQRISSVLARTEGIIALRQNELQTLDGLIKARFVEIFGEPIANPMGWPVKRLKDLSVLITNGNTPKGGSENYVENGIIFLRSQNVWRNRIELDDVAFIDEATHESMKKSSLHHDDILITKTGRINTENSSLGRAALFKGPDNSANINGHVYLVRLDGSIVPEFVVTILTGEAYRKYIRKVCVGGIDKRQINVDQVEDFPIIIPPHEQQKAFAAFVTQVDKSKVVVQKALDEAQLLFDSLMQQYFGRGCLWIIIK
ncbi:MAG: restriction endonuclease subunit S [Clostridia bacterium]|nr:restriction endonuclease subunit S [Clostridia bacterium]